MESLSFQHAARRRAGGTRQMAIVGVVASGNLEVLVERVLPNSECQLEIRTAAEGFGEVWTAVAADFVERYSPGGLRFSVNDGGARPDTVLLRLAQAARLMERSES
ncbi:malonate decarboxylase acyl carrier protein [Variovorax saccharolyticus]|uniref:malonate decarboxylase acyl carrier protein n=1 Tax=Variovorax saccharolyticus TaxID=3053516 RepID=UPI0025767B0A|nr:malonate decarboxylase acyl carrier protein [Variovorax sp. J22R187]MDM0022807.1 malonate decarboxylase acyl carrier protein [Variovorax sp. J22R187]